MNKILHCLVLQIILACICVSCRQTSTPAPSAVTTQDEYSRLLHIERHDDYTLVSISDPWTSNGTLHRYALVKGQTISANLPKDVTVIHTPLKNMCVSTSVHVNLFKQLGMLAMVGSVCDANYILDQSIQSLVKQGRIIDAGSSANPNIEKLVQANTDAILMSPLKGISYGVLEKTEIPIIECADYMETSALGRAEWIKFYGMLVGKEHESDSIFHSVCNNYRFIQKKVQAATHKPKLLVDMMVAKTWYLPGGNSIYGTLFADAGADYILGDSKVSGTQSLSLEKVMAEALDADVWLIKYGQANDFTYQSLGKENSAYTQFKAFKTHNIYGCNTLKVPFYDEVPFRPDLMLADVVKILHPEILPNHKLKYYTPLK